MVLSNLDVLRDHLKVAVKGLTRQVMLETMVRTHLVGFVLGQLMELFHLLELCWALTKVDEMKK
jgi:hypothetical protein